ncbi:retrotransposon protein, putative, ty1-copia subclass [Tanacetum coccineum]
MYIIEQPIPPAPVANFEAQVLADYNAIYDAHNEVACLMLGSMTPELYRQFESHSPYEMLQELKSMFEKQAGVERDLMKIGGENFNAEMKCGAHDVEVHRKGKGKGKDKPVYTPKPENPKPSAKEHLAKDETCHHCKKVGHWKRNCLVYLAELIKKKKQVGTASSSVICLDNCHYAPTITRGVVSVSYLVDNGFIQCFTNYGISVSKNDVLYFNAIPRDGIYKIDMLNLVLNVNSIYNVSNKRANHNLDSTYLWHCRIAHISKKRIKKLQHDGILKSMDDESFDQCVSSLSGKMTRKLFSHHTERATDLLRLIHTDVCGLRRHVSRHGASYFITFTDDYSRYGYVYLLKHKHEVFETFKVFKNEVENQHGKTIKCLRSDRGGEYISQEFKDYLKAYGIV